MPGAIAKANQLIGRLDLDIYGPENRDEVLAFRCALPGNKAAKAAQAVIHRAVDDIAEFGSERPFFVLARDAGQLVGVIIFGLEHPGDPAVQVFTLGVARGRQREGIGTALKKIAMATVVTKPDWPSAIASTVHRTNRKMNNLNANLGIASDPDPNDGEFLVTGATVELVDGDVRTSTQ